MNEHIASTHGRFGRLRLEKRTDDLRQAATRAARSKMGPRQRRAIADRIWWKRATIGYLANNSKKGKIGKRRVLKKGAT